MRRALDRALTWGTGLCAGFALLVLLGIAGNLIWRGLPALNWQFLSQSTAQAGAAGGVFYQLVGTLILLLTALCISLPLAVALGLGAGFYLRGRRRRWLVLGLYTANGVPSVVYGIFGLLIFVRWLDWGKSWWVGGLLLGWMILPTVALALYERVVRLPAHYLHAAAALGLDRSRIAWAVVLPQSRAGLLSGTLLGLARAAGETAPILFAAAVFSGATWPRGLIDSPVLALPYHIFVLAQDTYTAGAEARLWATATVLLGLVTLLALLALPARLRLHEEAHHG